MDTNTPRQRYTTRFEALKQERGSWDSHWRDLGEQFLPRRPRFMVTDANKGTKKNTNIINNRPTIAVRTAQSGMMSGLSSPARPWFRLTTPDPSLDKFGPVRGWLHEVAEVLRQTLAVSNAYQSLHTLYGDLVLFGTSPIFLDGDPIKLLRTYCIPVGSYALAQNDGLEVDTLYRQLRMTVRQLVEKFGEAKCSLSVQNQYKAGQYDVWIDILHVVEPNKDQQPGYIGPKGMAFRSCWMELVGDERTGFLRESGYEENPVMVPRWDLTGEDVYGNSPGMIALGDARALQLLEKRKGEAIDKVVDPPMNAPSMMMRRKASLVPGSVNYVDTIQGGQTYAPAMMVPPAAIQVFEESIVEHVARIDTACYRDLWLMLADSDRREITAREVVERHEEKMMQLGPTIERTHNELFDPFIRRVYGLLLRLGRLPQPPDELRQMPMRVEYISVLAQAQKMLTVAANERLLGYVGSLFPIWKSAADKINVDEAIDDYADALGVNPSIVNPQEKVDQMRAQQAQQAAQAQALQGTMAAAQTAQQLSQTDTSGDNALTRLVNQTTGGT